MRNWERANDAKIDSVFFACIYDHVFQLFQKFERLFGYPWSGLYLHARSFRIPHRPMPYTGVMPCPEKIFNSGLLRGVAVLDDKAIEPMSVITKGKPVILFPDFTDVGLPSAGDGGSGLANKLKRFANGRPVVSLVGHLQWTKGIEEYTAAARHAAMRDVFFFLGGEVNWCEISESRRLDMQKVWESAGNIYAHLQYISTDAEMNAVVEASDVVYAAYRDFPNSSNILTKAAIFEKPVIVSDGYAMAERVRSYRLGEVVAEGDVAQIVGAMQRMLGAGYADDLRQRARWADYRADHSQSRLPDCFRRLLGQPTYTKG
jgi:glycosyltransferase involved in cell wall biosynthesis